MLHSQSYGPPDGLHFSKDICRSTFLPGCQSMIIWVVAVVTGSLRMENRIYFASSKVYKTSKYYT